MSKSSFGSKLTKCAAIALVFGLVGGTAFQGSSYAVSKLTGSTTTTAEAEETTSSSDTTIQATTTSATVTSTNISDMVANVMPSIVAITTMSIEEVQSFFGQTMEYEAEGAGSGIIIEQDDTYLYIATNNHVVEGAETVTVQFNDDSTATAEVRGTDASNDLAVIMVKLEDLSDDTKSAIAVATLGDSDSLSVGDSAIAIGNALGYGQSVTSGCISALNREVTSTDETTGATTTSYLIQTDAAINPGNSGGALLNSAGEVIGINSSKYSDTSVEGMGFAIPISTAKPILEELIANGYVEETPTAYLGIYGVAVSSDVAVKYNMPEGVYVASVVEGSGAEAAGISGGMVITQVDGEDVSTMEGLKEIITSHAVGDTITLTVWTNNNGTYESSEVQVTLTSSSDSDSSSSESSEEGTTNENSDGEKHSNGNDSQMGPQENGPQGTRPGQGDNDDDDDSSDPFSAFNND
ncbi:MAG: trypsin-like peptidase domain-containing protein [Lachnospiraceae bacterium]|nr:trypsin-like peptidase domain-containing protein [Lachnospiraceae bacterium]